MLTVDTDELSLKYRNKAIDIDKKTILITNYLGTEQEKDLTEPANCKGFGRIRHFKLNSVNDWPPNPLPIIPARNYLGLASINELRAQVFQNSVCNWRCWYCYVDFKLLNGDQRYASHLTCEELLDLYLEQENPPPLIDLSGGQPDLTPEWIPWMMEALIQKGLEKKVLLWSDDNLSNDFFWRYLSDEQISNIVNFKNYVRVGCFKGIDQESFAINTKADPALFNRQFELFERLIRTGIDFYAYITLTSQSHTPFEKSIPLFFDKIQKINEKFPLRIVPLKINEFTPALSRSGVNKNDLLLGQERAITVWTNELQRRFTATERTTQICDVDFRA